jgi:hypothetical protein
MKKVFNFASSIKNNNIKPHLMLLVLNLVIFLLLASCSSSNQLDTSVESPNFNDVFFLDDISCVEPCWNNLNIGESTEAEVLDVILSMEFVEQNSLRTLPQSMPDIVDNQKWVDGKQIIVNCINRLNPCLEIGIANDKLRDIQIELDYGLTLGAVIIRFGEPNYVGYEDIGGDVIDCRTLFIWENKQLALYSTVFNTPNDVSNFCYEIQASGSVDINIIVQRAIYLPVTDITRKIEINNLVGYSGLK